MWDGNKPLHEWKEFDFKETTPDDLITWIFEEDSFAPAAKIKGDKRYSIITDHLGTPTQGYNEEGTVIWERQLDSYGKIKMLAGDEGFCNYLYQGQSLDTETGLAYNRFRYYDNEEGVYISQDPIGLASGQPNFYAYVEDPNSYIDISGLTGIIYLRQNPKTKKKYVGKSKSPEAFRRRQTAHNSALKKSGVANKQYKFTVLEKNVRGKKNLQNREQVNIKKQGGIASEGGLLENKINAKRKKKAGYKK